MNYVETLKVDNCDGLVANAEVSLAALKEGNLEALGKCIDQYWVGKKFMAPGCEPTFVKRMMDVWCSPLPSNQAFPSNHGKVWTDQCTVLFPL
jgi:hypothetical protein